MSQTDRCVLLCFDGLAANEALDTQQPYKYLVENFAGEVFHEHPTKRINPDYTVYLCGNISKMSDVISIGTGMVFVIEELSQNPHHHGWPVVTLGKVPITIGGGIYYRKLFTGNPSFFSSICQEHKFQTLTEFNKPGRAFRKGIYITDVRRGSDGTVQSQLLRCSSNFNGPTEGLGRTDRYILDELNLACPDVLPDCSPFNHVLAQIYENVTVPYSQWRLINWFIIVVNYLSFFFLGRPWRTAHVKKARIKAHSDKTKDMPPGGAIAFCTFYDDPTLSVTSPDSKNLAFDSLHKGLSRFAKLHFRLKPGAAMAGLAREFSVTLYPDSAFIISLRLNSLYTHEIKPSTLEARLVPTRMGYVVRCSKTRAYYPEEGPVRVVCDGKISELREGTPEEIQALRELYLEENRTSNLIVYGDLPFSMNQGDYIKPVRLSV